MKVIVYNIIYIPNDFDDYLLFLFSPQFASQKLRVVENFERKPRLKNADLQRALKKKNQSKNESLKSETTYFCRLINHFGLIGTYLYHRKTILIIYRRMPISIQDTAEFTRSTEETVTRSRLGKPFALFVHARKVGA